MIQDEIAYVRISIHQSVDWNENWAFFTIYSFLRSILSQPTGPRQDGNIAKVVGEIDLTRPAH